jgi:hypothetical protein
MALALHIEALVQAGTVPSCAAAHERNDASCYTHKPKQDEVRHEQQKLPRTAEAKNYGGEAVMEAWGQK